eukprot:6800078-Pyramimonas_sp.AAC.1
MAACSALPVSSVAACSAPLRRAHRLRLGEIARPDLACRSVYRYIHTDGTTHSTLSVSWIHGYVQQFNIGFQTG